MKILSNLLVKAAQKIEGVNVQLRISQEEECKVEEVMQRKLRYIEDTMSKVCSLDRFPGNLTDYSGLKGQEYEIVDTITSDKSIVLETHLDSRDVHLDDRLKFAERLNTFLSQGVEGVIYCHEVLRWKEVLRNGNYNNYRTTLSYNELKGVPVRKKKQ